MDLVRTQRFIRSIGLTYDKKLNKFRLEVVPKNKNKSLAAITIYLQRQHKLSLQTILRILYFTVRDFS